MARPGKPRWADLRDSSNETIGPAESPPITDSRDSYGEAADRDLAESSRNPLSARLQCSATVSSSAPRDFAFLLRPGDLASSSGSAAAVGNGAVVQADRRRAARRGSRVKESLAADADTPSSAASPMRSVDLGYDGGPSDFSFLLEGRRTSDLRDEAMRIGEEDEDGDVGNSMTPVSSAAAAPRRRITRKRRQASSNLDPGGKRVCEEGHVEQAQAEAADLAEIGASEESVQHRLKKRQALIEVVKQSPEYRAFAECRDRMGAGLTIPVPKTPDGMDRTLSKRRWEDEVRLWRLALRHWSPDDMQQPA
jgi:hypothetical protein